MAERTEHTRTVFAWLKQLLPDRDPTGFVVAWVIADHVNHKTGEGYPSVRRIAQKAFLSKVTVIAAIERLEARGHLGIEHGQQGRGHPNRYRMLIKPRPADVLETGKGSASVPFRKTKGSAAVPFPKGAKGTDDDTRKGTVGEIKGSDDDKEKVQPLNQNLLREQLRGTTVHENKGAQGAPLRARAHAPRSDFNIPEAEQLNALAEAFAGTDFGKHVAQRANAKSHNGHAPPPPDDWPDDFQEQFCAAYPHPVGMREALRALASLRKKRGRPTWAELMDGIDRCVDAKPPDQKWLNPVTFIREERWNDRPAPQWRTRASSRGGRE